MFSAGARGSVAVIIGLTTSMMPSIGAAQGADDTSRTGHQDTSTTHIVVLDAPVSDFSSASDVAATVATHAAAHDVTTDYVYTYALAGYAAELTPAQVTALETDPTVAYVEEAGVAQLQEVPAGAAEDSGTAGTAGTADLAAAQEIPVGIQRIFGPDNPNLGIGGPDDRRVDADIAVIDSGVYPHPDLTLVDRVDCLDGGGCVPGGEDVSSHGTHVAGTAAAINDSTGVVGSAPGARIWSQKVCDNGCPVEAIVAAIDYVTAHAADIEVVNMSLAGPGENQAVADAIDASIAAGVVYVVAAGNYDDDVANSWPANHPDVVTVSALADSDGQPGGHGGALACRPESLDDRLADFSNWGAGVNIAAPGVCVTSTFPDGGYTVKSGTSMASPHTAGAAALLASGDQVPTDKAGVLALRDTLETAGNHDWTYVEQGEGDFHEPLLDLSDPAVFAPALYDPPVAAFDVSCDEQALTCDFAGSASHDPSGEPITEWRWDFGDGQSGTGETVTHTYADEAEYDVVLTVSAGGRVDTVAAQVVAGDPAWLPASLVDGGKIKFAAAQCADDPGGYYKFGGLTSAFNRTNAAHRYDFASDRWEALSSYPSTAEGPRAVCTDSGKIHVLGGDGGTGHHVYDTATDTWQAAAPAPRDVRFSAVGYLDGQVYVLGGGWFNQPDDRAHVYDIATDTWTDLGPLPVGITLAGHAQVGSDIYLVGGLTPHSSLAVALRYDMTTDEWWMGPSMAASRFEPAVTATSDALYAVGGYDGQSGEDGAMPWDWVSVDTVERLDLSSWPDGTWTNLDPLPDTTGSLGGACGPAEEGVTIGAVGGGDPLTPTGQHWQMEVAGESCAFVPPGG